MSIVKRRSSALTEDDVHAFAVETMPRFQVPRYIEFVDSLPRTPTGKLELIKLKEAWERGERAAAKDFDDRRAQREPKA